jgi:murein L,D-transpeptidase YcbB/YkuD
MDVMQLADSILNKNKDSAAFATNQSFQQLKEYLRRYYTAAQDSSWQTIPTGVKALRKGKSSPIVPIIKQHLQLTGDYSGTDTSQVYNDSLSVAIKSYKQRNGFDSTDAITDSVIKTLNVSPKERLEQIVVNLNRMQWMPQVKKENMIEVNIPTFMLNVYEANKKAFDMKVVVGKEGSNTMMFNGDLNQIVFSPYWNVPESIVKDEIMPAMKSDPAYLKKKNMEIVKKNDSVPVIRQLPGKDNSLGRVKFLFPNTYDIFFHDTPAKGLFEQDKRAFSHGCIRLEDPVKLATYLLKDDPSWTPEKIQQAMNSGKEQFVKLKNSMPVSITYYTAWVDENGGLNFREDVYGQDKKTAAHLFTDAAYLQTPASIDSASKKDTGHMRL